MTISTSVDTTTVELAVLDVGHGNTAIIRDGDELVMVDCSLSAAVVGELARTESRHVKYLVISHSDSDHMRGAARLLALGFSFDVIFANADSAKDSEAWEDFRLRVDEEVRAGRSKLTGVHVGNPYEISTQRAKFEVIHPDANLSLVGPTRTRRARAGLLTSNDCSAVLRVHIGGRPMALLAGDLTAAGFERIKSAGLDMRAPILVFPHHGGRSGASDDRVFAMQLCDAVQPEHVIFSHGRNSGHGTPRQEILDGVRQYSKRVRVACTQLSLRCHPQNVIPLQRHLLSRPSAGIASNSCCAGTIVFRADNDGHVEIDPGYESHSGYIRSLAHALCNRA
ncbi:ComEC/Rec2 family competence protein [Micromonospora sp. NPDC005113]